MAWDAKDLRNRPGIRGAVVQAGAGARSGPRDAQFTGDEIVRAIAKHEPPLVLNSIGVERRVSPGRDAVLADTKIPRPESSIEAEFALQIRAARLLEPQREYEFLPPRKFRLDFAWPVLMIAVEVQGKVHRIDERFEADIEKRALALLAGWQVLEVSGATIRSGQALVWLEKLLDSTENPL